MRSLAALLMGLGILVGMLMAYFVGADRPAPWELEWVVWIGAIKLGLTGSLGLLAAGAFLRRIAIRRERRERLSAASRGEVEDTTER